MLKNNISKVYADLIRKGIKTIKQVPKSLKTEVEQLLKGESNA